VRLLGPRYRAGRFGEGRELLSPLSPDSRAPLRFAVSLRPSEPTRDPLIHPNGFDPTVSTRKLIIAALVTGLAILVAFAIQVTTVAR